MENCFCVKVSEKVKSLFYCLLGEYFTVAWTQREIKSSKDKSSEYLFISSSFFERVIVVGVTIDGLSHDDGKREEIHLKYDGILTIFMPHFLLIFLRHSKKITAGFLCTFLSGKDFTL